MALVGWVGAAKWRSCDRGFRSRLPTLGLPTSQEDHEIHEKIARKMGDRKMGVTMFGPDFLSQKPIIDDGQQLAIRSLETHTISEC